MKMTARYRARMEWSGIELFDRLTGSSVKPCESEMESLRTVLDQLLVHGMHAENPLMDREDGPSFFSNQRDGSYSSPNREGGSYSSPNREDGSSSSPNLEGGSYSSPNLEGGSSSSPNLEGGSSSSPNLEGGSSSSPSLEGGSSSSPKRRREELICKYGLIKNNVPDIEPLIDTPYPKSQDFASAPRRIYFELTRRCNLNCKSCFNRSFSSTEEMTLADIEKISRRLYETGVYEIRCTGGEPTLREDFFDILGILSGLGFYISVGTNGNYTAETMNKMLASPVDFFILSLDGGTEIVNDAVRGAGTFRRAVDTLEKMSSTGCRIRINTLIRRGNHTYEDIRSIAEIADRYHAESINCIPLRPVTNDPEMLQRQLDPVLFREFITGLNRLRGEFKTDFVTTLDLRLTSSHDRVFTKEKSCAAGREGAVISPYGEIYGCSYSPASSQEAPWEQRKPYVAGNVLEEDVLKIWNDSDRWAIYRDLDRYKHPACKTCSYYLERRCIGNCPIMDKNDPAAFDPYCYLHIKNESE